MLKDVILSSVEPSDKCFLIREHEGRKYIGTVLIGDPSFCHEIYAVLIKQRDKPIQEIGDIDLSSMSKKQQ